MKQCSLTSGLALNHKSYCVYKNPKGDYQLVVERFCLRDKQKKTGKENQILKEEDDKYWKQIERDQVKIKEFLKLKPEEKDFVRLSVILVPPNLHSQMPSLPSFVLLPNKI